MGVAAESAESVASSRRAEAWSPPSAKACAASSRYRVRSAPPLRSASASSAAPRASRTSLPAYSVTLTSGRGHVDALATAIAAVGKVVRMAIDETAGLGDADTADLLTGVSRELDKQLWFLEAHLQSPE